MSAERIRVYLALIAAMVFWAFSFIWTRSLLSQLSPVLIIVIRLSISALFLTWLGFITKQHHRIRKADIKPLLLLALFNPFLYFLGENFAMQTISPTVAAVFIATIPVFTSISAYFLLAERLLLVNYVGIFLSVLGVLFVVVQDNFQVKIDLTGFGFIMLAVFAAVTYTLLIKKLSGNYNAISITFYQNSIGLVYFVPVLLFINPNEVMEVTFTSDMIMPILGLSILCSSLAYVFFSYGILHLGASKANVFSNIIPIFTALFSFFIFAEVVSSFQLLGIALVVGGLFLSQLKNQNGERK